MEEPYIMIGRILTINYFAYFIIIVPLVGYGEEILSYYGRIEFNSVKQNTGD